MKLISVLRVITNHELNKKNKIKATLRFIKWQLSNMFSPYPVVYPFIGNAKLVIQKGMNGATGNLYCGLHEFNEMAFLIHLLREKDSFLDVGANVGSYTVLASAYSKAKTVSVEPSPSTFSHLLNNISINNISEKVIAYNVALGAQKGLVEFTKNSDTTNHVAVSGEVNTVKVPIEKLDSIFVNHDIPLLIKIDVEGFETEVLKGADKTLLQKEVKAIIIELNGSGERYNYDERKIHSLLIELGFQPYQYRPMERRLMLMNTFGKHNTIYIRDLDFVQERIISAPKFKILDFEV